MVASGEKVFQMSLQIVLKSEHQEELETMASETLYKLREMAGISPSTIAKLGRNENINTEVIIKICQALKCDICDVMAIVRGGTLNEDSNDDEYKPSS